MKKWCTAILFATGFWSASGTALAVTVSSNLTVSVTLTSVCTAVGPGTMTFAYTAFQGAAAVGTPVNMDFNCTRNVVISAVNFNVAADAVDTSAGTAGGARGVAAGLQYVLSSTAPTLQTAGTAATAVLGGTGTQDVRRVAVSGSIAAGQAGGAAAATSQVRVLTITF